LVLETTLGVLVEGFTEGFKEASLPVRNGKR